jgi:membrane protein
MGEHSSIQNHVDKKRTGWAVREAFSDVQHATRPRPNTLKEAASWLVALLAGAAFAWRSFKAGVETTEPQHDDETAKALVTAQKQRDEYKIAAVPIAPRTSSLPPGEGKATSEASPESAVNRTESAAVPEKAHGVVALGKELMARFNAVEGSTRAAALAFVGILSLVPLLLFALAAIGFVIHDPQQAAGYVQRLMANLMPGQEASQAANQFIQQTHIIESARTLMNGKWWAAGIGVLALLWSAVSLFVTASAPMNTVWEVKETRSFIKLRLVCLYVFLGAGLLFALSLAPTSGPDSIQSLHIPWLGLPKHPPFLIATLFQTLFFALAVLIDMGMFAIIYKFLPNANVTWKAALFGAAITGLLWELFKKGFAVYLAHFGNYNKLYGALGGIFLLVTWIYYSCMVLLVGAILSKMYHEHKEEGGVAHKAMAPANGIHLIETNSGT